MSHDRLTRLGPNRIMTQILPFESLFCLVIPADFFPTENIHHHISHVYIQTDSGLKYSKLHATAELKNNIKEFTTVRRRKKQSVRFSSKFNRLKNKFVYSLLPGILQVIAVCVISPIYLTSEAMPQTTES